jgi:hypothetical protein
VAQEELGWGAAWGMSGMKFAIGCYWVTPARGRPVLFSPKIFQRLRAASIPCPSQCGMKSKKNIIPVDWTFKIFIYDYLNDLCCCGISDKLLLNIATALFLL